jgi:hypothetical protein
VKDTRPNWNEVQEFIFICENAMFELADLLTKYPLLTKEDIQAALILGSPAQDPSAFVALSEGQPAKLTSRGQQLYQVAFELHAKSVIVANLPFVEVLRQAIALTNELRLQNRAALELDLDKLRVSPQQRACAHAVLADAPLTDRLEKARQYAFCSSAGSNIIPIK